MATLTIRNIPDELHKALKRRAMENDRSTEAEVRAILAPAVQAPAHVADVLIALGQSLREGLHGAEISIERDKRPFEPTAFE